MRSLFAVALLLASAAVAAPRQAFVFVLNGQTITNGEPVNNKAIRARFVDDFFWFTRDSREYLVRDAATLRRIREVYTPVFDATGQSLGWTGEQLQVFAKQMEVMREQLAIGVEPRPGESSTAAARRTELKAQQNLLAMRQNELARKQNEVTRRGNPMSIEKINERIEVELAAISAELIRSGVARPVTR